MLHMGRPRERNKDLPPGLQRKAADAEEIERAEYAVRDAPWLFCGSVPNDWYDDNRLVFEMTLERISTAASSPCGIVATRIRPAIYFLFVDVDLLYIGMSNEPYRRLISHGREGKIPFNRAAFVEVPALFVTELESFYITRERPPYNVRGVL